ncbi:hypothetical protein [Hymenobacter sp. PAMC 26628]|uniref:hypothetical protein n=1 Tax=Hymenobacter sp. PAMC 26628 TaxID=1484118 RepID=UPI00076FF3DA|nr:hypothetical protein [Hymenobacter sp. PAMC 26628]AMJ67163.1 hypothetical protein AXW84_18315 [Hymenobacter sp. PAMC 26628]
MKTLFRPLLLVAAVAAGLSVSACGDSNKYGSTHVEESGPKHGDIIQANPSGDSIVAGLRRPGKAPSQEQGYEAADTRTDSNHDGRSDK